MIGFTRWRVAALAFASLVFVSILCICLAFGSREDDRAFQQRLSRWGMRSQPQPNDVNPWIASLRRPLGDALFTALVGNRGRVVGAHRAGATREQLAQLLLVQPILYAFLGGMKEVDDRWVNGLRDRSVIRALFLDGTSVTDASGDVILEMTDLAQLSLCDTAVSDQLVARYAVLPSLRKLYVGGPNIKLIRLVNHEVVDSQGRAASRSNEPLSIRGKIDRSGLSGPLGYVRVMVRPPTDPEAWESVPYGWNASKGDLVMPIETSPGHFSFQVDLAGLPPGPSKVEVWVDYQPEQGKTIYYRLDPFTLELADLSLTGDGSIEQPSMPRASGR